MDAQEPQHMFTLVSRLRAPHPALQRTDLVALHTLIPYNSICQLYQ